MWKHFFDLIKASFEIQISLNVPDNSKFPVRGKFDLYTQADVQLTLKKYSSSLYLPVGFLKKLDNPFEDIHYALISHDLHAIESSNIIWDASGFLYKSHQCIFLFLVFVWGHPLLTRLTWE